MIIKLNQSTKKKEVFYINPSNKNQTNQNPIIKIAENDYQTVPKHKKLRNKTVGFGGITLTVTLCVSGRGKPSLGLITLYLPTDMALLFISSDMHFVAPDWRS